MFSLLAPAALWTLAALALPLAIHLRRPPPRTVRLGSLRFFRNAAPRRLKSLRWRELFLLCTRLGLLAALSLWLAGPRWRPTPPAGSRRWGLLDPTAAPAGDSLARWRALRASGGETRLLAPGFPAVKSDAAPDAFGVPDLWSLLREADAELPAGSTLIVFSPGRVAALRGTRPALGHCKVEWVQTPDRAGDAPAVWIESARILTPSRSVRITARRGDARASVLRAEPLDETVDFPGGERWQIETTPGEGGGPFRVRAAGREGRPADPPGPWTQARLAEAASVLVLHDADRAANARCVEAAVRAAAASCAQPVDIQNVEVSASADDFPLADWVFWLSARPVPAPLAARAPRLLSEAPGAGEIFSGWVVAGNDPADGVPLSRRVPPPTPPAGAVLWRDSQGDPLLCYSHPASGERWEFRGRFDPAWNDLPRTTALPAALRALMFPPPAADPAHDLRLADPSQCLPDELPANATVAVLAPAGQTNIDLRWPAWMLVALLFLAERVLSLRRPAAPPASALPRAEPAAAVVSR